MAEHMWGDGFDFDELDQVIEHLRYRFKAELDIEALMKEKYGTIRYEYLFMWHLERASIEEVRQIIDETVEKYPHLKDEIMEDAVIEFDYPEEIVSQYWKTC